MTEVIGFVNQKGGCGKTTTCLNIGTGLRYRQFKVLIYDTDPQLSATDWKAAGELEENADKIFKDYLPEVKQIDEEDLVKEFLNNSSHDDYDYILIDGAAGSKNINHTANIIKVSTSVVIPLAPSPLDVWATAPVLELVKARQDETGKPNAGFIVSRARRNSKLEKKLIDALGQTGIELLGCTYNLDTYSETVGKGQTIYDSEYDTKANRTEISNMDNLCMSVMNLKNQKLVESV